MNDEKAEPEFKPRKSPRERLGENLELLSKRFEKIERNQETDNLRMKKAIQSIDLLKYDLQNPQREYGYTPTREVAVAALKQSQGFISVEKLEGHEVIKDIKEAQALRFTKRQNQFNSLQRQINDIPSPDNMNVLLKQNFEFQVLEKKVESLEVGRRNGNDSLKTWIEELNKFKETYNAYDHPTGMDFDELKSDYETLRIRHDELVHFLMGVFSSMKMDPVAQCIENYKVSVAE